MTLQVSEKLIIRSYILRTTRGIRENSSGELQEFWHHFTRYVWESVIMMKMYFVSFPWRGIDSPLEVSQLFRVHIDYNCRSLRE